MKKICICLILALLSIINASAIYVDDISYILYSDGTATCVLPSSNGTYYESIRYKNELVIQPVVTSGGKEYRVTRLSNPSFKEDENSTFSPEVAFKSVKIPCGIEIYNPSASSASYSPIRQFSRLVYKNLKVLYFVPDGVHCYPDLYYPKTLKFVGFAPEVSVIASHLLTYNENLQKIVLLNPLPPAIGYQNYTTDLSNIPFNEVARKIMREATLYIPKGSLEKYLRDPIWGCFLNIEEIDVDNCDFDSLANEKCKYRVDTNAVACNSFVWKNETYTESGNYEKLYTAKNGCDSIVTLHLTINKPKATDVYKTVETSYNWDGDEYSLSGEYNKTYTAKNGCDSIVTLHLTIAPPIEQNISVTACGSYTWNGEQYKTSGVYVKHFETPTGNDSTVTLNLTIYDTPHNEITVKTGGSYIWGGASYSQSGDYQRTFAASCGCDSIVTLHLTIIPPVEKEISATACGGYEWNNKTYTESGDYQSSFRLKNGNDSIVTLHLTINKPVYKEVSKTASNSYTWDGTVYKKSGNYTNTYTAKNGCDSVVTLHLTIDGTYIIDSSDDNEGTVTIDGDAGIGKTVVITAEPKEGHKFKQWSDGNTENPRTVTITDGMNLKAEYELEVYTIQVSSNNSSYGNVAGNGDYEYGSTAFIMASANNGYKFVKWNDGNTAVIRTIKVKKDSAFVAEFAVDESAVTPSTPTGSYTIGAADPDGGSVSVDGEAGIGKTVTLTATPKDGYKFKQWSDGNTENPRTVTITEGMNLKAEYELEVYAIQVSSNNSNYGNVAGNGDYEYGSTAFIMASANNGYKFVKWNDGNTAVIRTIKVKKDSAFVAEFAVDESAVTPSTPTGSYTIGAADPDGGSVSVDGEAGIGKTVTLTATPKDGYKFKQWSDGNTENPRIVTITNGMNLKAEFEAYERTWKLNALEWNEDSTKVTVYFYCPEDGKTKSVEAKPVVVEQAATCHEKGSKKRVVTVAFEGQIYEESEETVVDAPRQNIVKKMWGDVLTVVDPNKEFIQYEWYRNGEFVSNKAYVSEAGGLTGEYTLQVTKRDGSKVCSNTVTMSEKRSSAALRVYPNPATDNVTIEGDFEEGSEIRIVDMNGVLVKKTKAATDGRATVMTIGMTAGAYTVIAGNDTARLIKK